MKSLKADRHILSNPGNQLEILQHSELLELMPFQQKMEMAGLYPLKPGAIEILQVNVGKMCNQTCRHCHVDAGPDRKEIMTWETMTECITALEKNPSLTTVDITGGAPELNPNFRPFVEEISRLGRHIMVRCNLTIILANKRFYDLPGFFKQHKVEVVSSLPFYSQDRTDRHRGQGVFDTSIRALQMLNDVGYGDPEAGLLLNLVYNPAGAFLPAPQSLLEQEFRIHLKKLGIVFNHLYVITNMPISRFLNFLLESGNYEKYMDRLVNAFNPAAAEAVMCRNTISIGWDGRLYDCDFNQMLDLVVEGKHFHISDLRLAELSVRNIKVGQHCYGCTAGSGSSCGGATVTQ